MEYYIMKCYENEKKEEKLKIGLNRFTKSRKIAVISLLVLLIISASLIIIADIVLHNICLVLASSLFCVATAIVLYILDNKDQKNNLYEHTNEYKKQLLILNNILKNTFDINSKEKIMTLIEIYKTYITKKEEEDKTRNKLIITLFSGLAALLSTSLANLKNIGMDINTWIYITAITLIVFCAIGLCLYFYKYADSLKKKYEYMVNDLESLILFKY